MKLGLLLASVVLGLAAPAFAQHEDHGAAPTAAKPVDAAAGDEAGTEQPAGPPTSETPPPPEAGSGPPRAADAIWGAEAMRASREGLKEMGSMHMTRLMADRAEYRARDGRDGLLWDLEAGFGADLDKLVLKSEGEAVLKDKVERAELQALWSHAIAPFFDLQAGVRHDFDDPSRTYAVLGVEGLAPFRIELDAAAFLSHEGELTGRFEAELDQNITQRFILQPRIELNLSAQDVPERGIGAGLDRAEVGLRVGYQFVREFMPYIGIEQEWRFGRSARFARLAGDDPSVTNFVIGIRFWF